MSLMACLPAVCLAIEKDEKPQGRCHRPAGILEQKRREPREGCASFSIQQIDK